MSHSKDCVFVLNTDRLTACIAGGIERTPALQAKEAELMAALQLVIAVVHPVAYVAFLHVCRVFEVANWQQVIDNQWQSSAVFFWPDRLFGDFNAPFQRRAAGVLSLCAVQRRWHIQGACHHSQPSSDSPQFAPSGRLPSIGPWPEPEARSRTSQDPSSDPRPI